MRKIIAALLLLPVLVMSAMASDVQSMIEELPAVEDLRKMDMDRQREVYDRTQAAYDAYMALSEEEQAEIAGGQETFEELFGYFNTLTMPVEAAREEPAAGSNLLSTVLACLIGILLAQKIITKRKL